jgi:dTDP-glucose 4,6-dehydratase
MLQRQDQHEIHVIDNLGPTSNPEFFGNDGQLPPGVTLHRTDINDLAAVESIVDEADAVIHLAAESYVDRSIDDPVLFSRVNVEGTVNLLTAARRRRVGRFVHVSTDEVWGHLQRAGRFHEEARYAPRNPYAASKAAADHFVRVWGATWGLDYVIVHFTNLFGPYQFPEKLIPRAIARLGSGRPVELYGDGRQVRSWLSVTDAARGLLRALEAGRSQRSYIIGSEEEWTNLDLIRVLIELLGGSDADMIQFVTDRPGHDLRYAVDCSRARRELGWAPQQSLHDGLRETVAWYRHNRRWVSSRMAEIGTRLGLAEPSCGRARG